MVALIFLSGPIKNTDLTGAVVDAFGWIMPYSSATLRSGSAITGKFTVVFWVALISFTQPSCELKSLTLTKITLVFLLSNSSFNCAVRPSSVVQIGVKSAGCENKIAQPLPIHSWKLISPLVVVALKSGAVSPICKLIFIYYLRLNI